MNRRRELCRNFQRGSCQFGDRCKFLHATQPQSKPNPFGFVTQNPSQPPHTAQQQRPNPFGFGVQNNSNDRDASNFGARRQVPTKPFENKWTRNSVTNQSQQTEAQPQAPVHKCTDSDSCKRQIADDFKNEAPIWKLTCYGHCKYGPCDVSGDISYEELRAAAYEDSKQGLGLQSIVDRERNLLNSKLIEFGNLLQNPYVVSQSPSFAGMSQFPGTNNGMQLPHTQSNGPPSFSSFSQLKASANVGSNILSQAPGIQPSTLFGRPSLPQNNGQSPGGLEMKFGTAGVFGGQLSAQRPGISPNPNAFNFSNALMSTGNQSVPFPTSPPQFSGSMNNPLPGFSHGPNLSSNATPSSPTIDDEDVGSGNNGIWMKEKWEKGEIPEEEPPQRFC
ncbi:LOW QUALITY PROTEIN: zinc finger CCCH domain-containing protein 46 [Dioscorea cayenensis subsp. rotundata]|uniref:LOW QUALITY PROTEIN: zinc finger CCCH domain-containing protein 46 n=1 Tax=Dioscorea cayennensis subsp. rotundata TaxID=55577 RepID=A0AB40D1T1_DIOCR|nr:LOW QUALITY PROTEIN: zinc finger CCCH domain-containing protein 46 [Dioscorea cayenensis subsp. rotundata]